MQPTSSSVHVNRPLTNISIAFLQNPNNFVATRAFPNIPVQKQSDRYFTYDRGEFNRDEMQERAPATESAGGGYTVDSTPTYYCRKYSFHKDIDDETRANEDSPLDGDADTTEYLTHKALIKREKIFATNFMATSKWTTDMPGVVAGSYSAGTNVIQWNDAASHPGLDVAAGKTKILESTGFEPDTMIVGYKTSIALQNHPEIIDRVKYVRGVGANEVITLNDEDLASFFKVRQFLVMKSIENTAAKGDTNVHAFIGGGKNALLCYAAPKPSIRQPSAGYNFSWTGLVGAGNMGNRIKKFRMDPLDADRIEIDMAFDMKLIAADLGYYFTTIVA